MEYDTHFAPMTGDKSIYTDSTYEIVSKVAYLLGISRRIFENEHEPPKLDVYNLNTSFNPFSPCLITSLKTA